MPCLPPPPPVSLPGGDVEAPVAVASQPGVLMAVARAGTVAVLKHDGEAVSKLCHKSFRISSNVSSNATWGDVAELGTGG